MQIGDFPQGTVSVLLLPKPKKDYIRQVQSRDIRLPEKAGQEFLKWYRGFEKSKNNFDHVFTKLRSSTQTLKEVLDLVGK